MKKYYLSALLLTLSLSYVTAQVVDTVEAQIECTTITHALTLGSRDSRTGGDVTTLQTYLVQANYLDADPTGYFGKATKKAVQDFQTANGIAPQGNVGPYTRAKIKEVSCGAQSNTTNVSTNNNQLSSTNFNIPKEWRIVKIKDTGLSFSLPNYFKAVDGMEDFVFKFENGVTLDSQEYFSYCKGIYITNWKGKRCNGDNGYLGVIVDTPKSQKMLEDMKNNSGGEIHLLKEINVGNKKMWMYTQSAMIGGATNFVYSTSDFSVTFSISSSEYLDVLTDSSAVFGISSLAEQILKTLKVGLPVVVSPTTCKSEVDGMPVITSLSSTSGPVGTVLEVKGCNLAGFEGDMDIHFEKEDGTEFTLTDISGSYRNTGDKLMKVTVKEPCQKGETIYGAYSGIPSICNYPKMTPGVYKVYTTPWNKKSNVVTFTVTSGQNDSNFRVIKLYDNEGKKAILSVDDSSIVEMVTLVLKDDKDAGFHLNDMNQIIISSGIAFVSVGRAIGGAVEDDFTIDIKNKKIIEKFTIRGARNNVNQNSFVFGDDRIGMSYYKYGNPSSIKIPNSILKENQSYIAYSGPEGAEGYKVIATTTNSITFGVFDKTTRSIAPGDDAGYYKKVGEKTFIVP